MPGALGPLGAGAPWQRCCQPQPHSECEIRHRLLGSHLPCSLPALLFQPSGNPAGRGWSWALGPWTGGLAFLSLSGPSGPTGSLGWTLSSPSPAQVTVAREHFPAPTGTAESILRVEFEETGKKSEQEVWPEGDGDPGAQSSGLRLCRGCGGASCWEDLVGASRGWGVRGVTPPLPPPAPRVMLKQVSSGRFLRM